VLLGVACLSDEVSSKPSEGLTELGVNIMKPEASVSSFH
jgi:hypothetical protein